MPRLNWISDEDLETAMSRLTKSANDTKDYTSKRMLVNVVDPFSSLLIASTFGLGTGKTLEGVQHASSILHGMGNALGTFHQEVLGSVDGWVNYDAGYDIENAEQKIFAEVKNKHNTMNAPNKRAVVQNLETVLMTKKDWTAWS